MINSQTNPYVVAQSGVDERALFYRKTYTHLALAVLAFAALEYVLITMTPLPQMMGNFLRGGGWKWMIILGGFMGVSYVAQTMANSSQSKGMQYAGLGLFVVGYSIIFVPMLSYAASFAPDAIKQAGMVTIGLFLGLTAIAFTTKKDFSFLGGFLKMGFFVALGLIIAGSVFGFNLGMFFSAAMILLAAGSILYSSSAIIHRYHSSQYIAASVGLFSGVATMFWYVLQMFMNRD